MGIENQSSCLTVLPLRADCTGAIVMQTPPRFKLVIENEEQPDSWGLYSSMAVLYEARLFHNTRLEDLSKEMMRIYWALRNLMSLKDAGVHMIRKVEIPSWSNMVERTERRLIAMIQSPVLRTRKSNLLIFTLYGNAGLIHTYMFLRDIPRALPFYSLLLDRLRAAIEAADLANLHNEYPELMMWILLMGGLGSVAGPARRWFAKLFAQACIEAGFRGGNAISYALADFQWSDLYRSPATVAFWNDVARAQGMESGGYEVRVSTDHISGIVYNTPYKMPGSE